MRLRRLAVLAAVGTAALLAVPAAAWAHAYLIRTAPSASVTLNGPPSQLSLTFNEAVEPRFAITSVTDAGGHQQTTGRPQRSPSNPDTLITPLKRVPEGWYLVFWRAISADGHPVRGAFTFAVGPNPGPPPQFVIPSITETAATSDLVTARWLVFLTFMAAIGLFAMRVVIARPLARRLNGVSLRPLTVAFALALAVALVANLVYVDLATAKFAFKSALDLPGVIPLMRDSAFGRGYLDLELMLLFLAVSGTIAILSDRPERGRRSLAGLLSVTGAAGCATAALLVPGLSGHAAQSAPRGLSLLLDWLHLASGSLWLGGLAGLLVLAATLRANRLAGLALTVPRFSAVALGSVAVLLGSGIGASLIHLPTLASLWQTSYGDALIAKIGLLLAAMLLASVNLLRTRPRLQAAAEQPQAAAGAGALLRALVSGEVLLVAGALVAASILSSLPPPPKALATIGKPSASVGPGEVVRTVTHGSYQLRFEFTPNKVAVPDAFTVTISKGGKPVRGADVTATFTMLDMEMSQLAYTLPETSPGTYTRSAPALVMVGHWGLGFDIRPPGGAAPFTVLVLDHAEG